MNIRIFLLLVCSLLMAVQTGCAKSVAVAAFDAGHPSRSGYRLVFDDEFNDARGISFNSSEDGPPGFRWYARLFDVWGGVTSAPEAFSTADGILTIAGGQLGTAAPARNAQGFVGTTFANGAYFEARIAFDAATVRFDPRAPITKTNWWPSFYAMPIEYLTKTSQWPGQARGFAHFAEDDFFEAWLESRRYGGTMHDWYGLPGCRAGGGTSGYCDVANDGNSPQVIGKTLAVAVPWGTDWRQFHVVGQLWVSGQMTSDKRGFVQFYFDGKPTSNRVVWRDGPMQGPPPAGETAFSILDSDHLVVYIGSPAHTPLRVDWVRIWQLPTAAKGAD